MRELTGAYRCVLTPKSVQIRAQSRKEFCSPDILLVPLLIFQRGQFSAVSDWRGNEQANTAPRLNCAVILPKARPAHWLPSFFSVTGRKAKAVYPCEAEHDSELSFQVGAIFSAGECYRLHQSLIQNLLWNIGFKGSNGGLGWGEGGLSTQSDHELKRVMKRGGTVRSWLGDTDFLTGIFSKEARLSFNESLPEETGFCWYVFMIKPFLKHLTCCFWQD